MYCHKVSAILTHLFFCFLTIFTFSTLAVAQDKTKKTTIGTTPEEKPQEKPTPVELISAGKLIGNRIKKPVPPTMTKKEKEAQKNAKNTMAVYVNPIFIQPVYEEEDIRIVVKDSSTNVLFRQNNSMLYCDSAVQYLQQNKINAYGNIKIVDADGTVITGDSLLYEGATRIARIRGTVVLKDETRVVSTCCMDYNLATKVGSYFNGGTVADGMTLLTSEKGYYYTNTKTVYFRKNVDYQSPDTNLKSDTLTYDLRQKKVIFNAKTYIKTKDGEVVTDRGQHYTESGKTEFSGRSKIDNTEYTISGDKLDYDKKTQKGIAVGNVEFYNKKDNLIILGDLGKHDGTKKVSEVYGNGVMIKPIEERKNGQSFWRDTLFLSADTLIAINDTAKHKRRLLAYNHVKMYRNDFQGKCDSLAYNLADSIIYFYYHPILWSRTAQMTADSINVEMRNNQISKMNMTVKSFIISQDSIKNLNQVKGRKILARFKNNEIKKIDVNGNAESLYYVLERDTVTMGLNFIKCAEMYMFFNDSSRLDEILFTQQPEGKFIPPHEIKEADNCLADFAWRIDEKPQKGEVLGIHNKNQFRSGELAKALMIIDDEYKVFLKDKKLFFYKNDAKDKDVLPPFFIQIYPRDKNDLAIDLRKDGFETQTFALNIEEHLSNGNVKHDIMLPDYKIKRLVIGQKSQVRGLVWQKIYDFPIKREVKKKKGE
jgi:lipopolysaccharide export system protein LptA